MKRDDPIQRAFAPILGQPAWGVRRGHGSFMTMEFGEPRADPKSHLPRGDWHLWIYCCRWRLTIDDMEIATGESSDSAIDTALLRLEGQAFSTVAAVEGRSRFDFATVTLETRPYDGSEQWMLFMPAEKVLSYRADGRYCLASGHAAPSERIWHSLL